MSTPGVTWTVTATIPETGFIPSVGPVEGFRITFSMSNGNQGHVFVASSVISNTEAVRTAIQNTVDSLVAVHNLSG